jgi:GTPase
VHCSSRCQPRRLWAHPPSSTISCADIAILTHSTTIQPRYQAVIHCEIVRQAARVVAMDRERLRSGDRACVRFRFLQRPEYLTPGTRFVFRRAEVAERSGAAPVHRGVAPSPDPGPCPLRCCREGRTKGIGMVVNTEMSPPVVAAH